MDRFGVQSLAFRVEGSGFSVEGLVDLNDMWRLEGGYADPFRGFYRGGFEQCSNLLRLEFCGRAKVNGV